MRNDEGAARRRRVVADAVQAIVVRDGLDAVTMRTVAREAGFSLGMVQRLFSTKDELLRHAMTAVADRLGRRAASLGRQSSPQIALRQFALILLAADGPDRGDALVWLAFVARAASAPELSRVLRGHYRPAQRSVRALLAEAGRRGELRAGTRPTEQSAALLALLDGLTVHLAVGLISGARARRIALAEVDALFACPA